MGFSYGVKFAVAFNLAKVIGENAHILALLLYTNRRPLQRDRRELVSYLHIHITSQRSSCVIQLNFTLLRGKIAGLPAEKCKTPLKPANTLKTRLVGLTLSHMLLNIATATIFHTT